MLLWVAVHGGSGMAGEARKDRKSKRPLPRTPVRPKVITKYMTPDEAAQWLVNDFRKRRNGDVSVPL